MELRKPRGTRDFLFEDMELRKNVEMKLRNVFERYGYREIKTPIFEHLKLFTIKSGEEIKEQMYHFKDKGGRNLALRPELTAPIARLYVNKLQRFPKPIKMYYFGSCFRYERPQAGRFRQFWQFGCELIGGKSPEAEAETIALAYDCLKELGLKNFKIHIGHMGIVRGMLEENGVKGEKQDHIMTLIDKGDKEELSRYLNEISFPSELQELLFSLIEMKGDSKILDEILDIVGYRRSVEAIQELKNLESLLEVFGVKNYLMDPGIARGLDYYTGIVFEIYISKTQICGGGTYNLIELFGGEKVESTGFAFGFDRLVEAVGNKTEKFSFADVFVAPVSDETREAAFKIAQKIRKSGISADVDLSRRKLGKLLSYADHLGVKYTIIVGKKELKQKRVTVKDMESGEQKEVQIDDLSDYLRRGLKKF
ncbi:histidyl-tRNA synthetase [Methanothermus fervidus DSM 2088]|uniref:Histidine--tRNA ligase n=1 Tax=Methanothermus fervidus (strain ATCC 43054 / DSM 2088 / JCM 10308 / V24 S) TaxID=523846 RepID=E3GWQ6_METFV|nr:histidine--tRNA ligase [Methanothermus fervidus]ADP77975.1 histidyl-tRNA synthetase [Methanothermus fervidus DSM 2088]